VVRDTSSSHLQRIASCYKYSDEDNSSESMKRPLITTTMSSSNASLETEEQRTRLEQQSKRLVWQAFLLGSAIGFVLHVVVFATCYTIFKIWGQHPTFSSSLSHASYCVLVLLSQVDIVICIGIWSTFVYTMTKSGFLYMRKKLDQDVDTPAGANSIRAARRLFGVKGIYFLVGVKVGTCSLWTIVHLRMGMVVPLTPLLTTDVVEFFLFYIMIKCFDWGRAGSSQSRGDEEEEEEEDDSFSGV
jgi:phosphotransferase system  glucose/maltose/N-acetylglucosamine-specific IIC component